MQKLIFFLFSALVATSCCSNKGIAEKKASDDDLAVAESRSPSAPEITEPIKVMQIPEPQEDIQEDKASNEEPAIIESPKEEETVSMDVFDHGQWNSLLEKHVTEQGNVNYRGFRKDLMKLVSYLDLLSDNPPEDAWPHDKKLAYWMNVYNAFTIKLILDNYPTKSIKDIKGPWSHRFIRIGEKWYTLNDVEHRIIRKMDEPRIHFALVCAAVSCPRLYNKAFTAKDLEADLELLTRGFLADTSKNDLQENSIRLSKIFKWYGGDFRKNGNNLIDFLNRYSKVRIATTAKKSFMDYNWALNE